MLAHQTPNPFNPIPKSVDSAPRVKNAKLLVITSFHASRFTQCVMQPTFVHSRDNMLDYEGLVSHDDALD